MKTRTPIEIGKACLEEGVTVAQYEEVQTARRRRLTLWKERNIAALIATEEELIALGEQVLDILKKG